MRQLQEDRGADQASPASAPTLTLPKGGGAVRGIGEKFSANPVTGTGSLTLPIPASTGRDGFAPHLSLAYDSGAGDGVFGVGWNLNLPTITRKTDKGLPRYADATDSDVFILAGSEDLVPEFAKNPDGSWKQDANGTFLFDEDTRDKFVVRRYRPRIESIFARIERWTRVADGDTHWRTLTKDNVLSVFGRNVDTRIANPDDATQIFSWLLCESYDDKGNAVLYTYVQEDDENADLTLANERNRRRTANRYIKSIRYGNRVPLLIDVAQTSMRRSHVSQPNFSSAGWMFELVFDYGEGQYQETQDAQQQIFATAQLAPPAGVSWPSRPDPFSTYRAGFEVRCYRLCRRVMMFHHFPDELGVADYLVRSIEFAYRQTSNGSFITSVLQSGYKRQADGRYLKATMPPVDFTYSTSPLDDGSYVGLTLQDVEVANLDNLPSGIDATTYRWIDLYGEGIAGVLSEQAEGWYYKPNLGEGKLGPTSAADRQPSSRALASGRQQLLDLAGDGNLELVELSAPLPGYFSRTEYAGWGRFRTFARLPDIDWKDANLKFVDLTGDGLTDVLITSDAISNTWYASLGDEGFTAANKVFFAADEEQGPSLIFADGTQSVFLADMSGDGLSDLVRIKPHEVCYWPNIGYGRFGRKVTLDNAPWFDDLLSFDPRRIRLADTDGSGPTDIIYLGRDGVRIFQNLRGNGLSDARLITCTPTIDNLGTVSVVDFLGRGTACLLVSSPLPANSTHAVRYLDLMNGIKPHLLVEVANNLGATTAISYGSSTQFYLADKAAGTPWITRLPFPVHVVTRVETRDDISGNRFVSRYAYHHGHFDGIEREFRGFGRVDQWDTDEFGVLDAHGQPLSGSNLDAAFYSPPVLTKTWFHTGVYREGQRVSRHFEHEYFREGNPDTGQSALSDAQFEAMLLADTVLPDLPAREIREAIRALKGSLLRQEVYGLDDSPAMLRPYSVSERNYTIEPLQPRGQNLHSVYFTHGRETVDFHYERQTFPVVGGQIIDAATAAPNPAVRWLADPRVTHNATLQTDAYGNVTQSVAIAYGRRFDDGDLVLSDADRAIQKRTLITVTDATFTNDIADYTIYPDAYRAPLSSTTRTFELINFIAAYKAAQPSFVEQAGITNLLRFEGLRQVLSQPNDGAAQDIAYEDVFALTAAPGAFCRRLIESNAVRYRKDNLSQLLAAQKVDVLALPGETYKLAFTPGLLTSVYERGPAHEDLLPIASSVLATDAAHESDRGGYVALDGDANWWIPSGRIYYDPSDAATSAQELTEASAHFFAPRRFVNPFGYGTRVDYIYDLLPSQTLDAKSNSIQVVYDLRVLQPSKLIDANGNQSFAVYGAHGLTVATALAGKDGSGIGDTVDDFVDSDANPTLKQLQDFAADPNGNAAALLKSATTRFLYDLDRYARCGEPPFAAPLVRETHVSDLHGATTKIQISFVYSDGFGRELQTKIQAEPGGAPQRAADITLASNDTAPGLLKLDSSGNPQLVNANPRWVGKGRTVFNNKGKPVKQYEPFFSSTHLYESEPEMTDTGVTPILLYDPIQRVVATLHPNHSYEKIVFDPWHQASWDGNDTVLLNPKTDSNVAGYFTRLPDGDYSPTWYEQRVQAGADVNEKAAASKTAKHAATPSVSYFDSLGRAFLAIADNGPNGAGNAQRFRTITTLDIENNQRAVTDANNRIVMRYDYDMLSNRVHQSSMEAGERWTLNDVLGKPIRTWDGRGHNFSTQYDPLRRPISQFVQGMSKASDPRTLNQSVLFEKTEYGEDQPHDTDLNLRTRVFRHSDMAGVVNHFAINPNSKQSEAYDFKGNLLRSSRRLVADATKLPDWANPPLAADETFTSSTRFDALNRTVQLVAPYSDQAGTELNVIQHVFNEANLLDQIIVWLAQTGEPAALLDAGTKVPSAVGVTNIDYTAKGQRAQIVYSNGVSTSYDYDTDTFRLTAMKTSLPSGSSGAASQIFKSVAQDLHYTYDPVGNITHIQDAALRTIFYGGQKIDPVCDYLYDPIYRLIQASGREHIGQTAPDFTPPNSNRRDYPFVGLRAQPFDAQAMRNYTESYDYDAVGNFNAMRHAANSGSWTRTYDYTEPSLIEATKFSNRLTKTTVGNGPNFVENYTYTDAAGDDSQGCMTAINSMQMIWDFKDQLQQVDLGGGSTARYTYDAAGERVRKIIERQNGLAQTERIYLGGFEEYREYAVDGAPPTLNRETLHVMDDKHRVAMVETRTKPTAPDPSDPPRLVRYQLGNHLGSVNFELDEDSQLISYEENTAFGNSSYQIAPRNLKSAKRYRYAAKERDEETGLQYFGARYYAAWIGRWLTYDPSPATLGRNLYWYCNDSPVVLSDSRGTDATAVQDDSIKMDAEEVNPSGDKPLYVRAFENWQDALKQNEVKNSTYWKGQYESLRAESYGEFSKNFAKKAGAFYAISFAAAAGGAASAAGVEAVAGEQFVQTTAGGILQSTVAGVGGSVSLEASQHAFGLIGNYDKDISGSTFSLDTYYHAVVSGAKWGFGLGVVGRILSPGSLDTGNPKSASTSGEINAPPARNPPIPDEPSVIVDEPALGPQNRATFEKYKSGLSLQEIISDLYRPGAKVGSGSTADAIRQELDTGAPVGDRFHVQKGNESITRLTRWLNDNPSALNDDHSTAERLIDDLIKAVNSGYYTEIQIRR